MLEASYGLNFFLKTHHKGFDLRYIYLRITVNGILDIQTKIPVCI